MLPLGGLLIAIFAGWIMQRDRVQDETGISHPRIFAVWRFALRYIAPLGIIAIFLHSLGLMGWVMH